MPAPAGRRAGDHAGEDPPPGEHDAPAGGSALHRGVLFELQQFDGAAAEHADEGSGGAAADAHGASWGPAQPASKGRWFAGVDLESPIGFVKGLNCSFASGAAAGRDGGEMGDISKKGHGVRRLVPMRRRPAERLASAMIFASFVAVAALVGVICVSSLNAAYQDERNTENLLHDARAFVPAKTGGTLPIDSFEDVQRPKGHVWAEHNFDTDFIDGDLGQEGASSPGRTQQLTNVPRPGHTIEAHVPGDHLHGKRVWGWLHKDKNSAAGHESSAAIQENLDKQADYIIGYPDLGKDEAARTQRLVGLRDPAAAERLGKLPPLGGRPKAAESVKNAQKAVEKVKGFINRAPGDVPTFKVPGQGAVHSFISGSRFKKAGDEEASTAASGEDGVKQDVASDQAPNVAVPSGRVVVIRPSSGVPVAIAMPHQVGMPTVNADVQIVNSPSSGTPPESKHVPFDWVKVNGLGRKGPADVVPKDHASRVSEAAKAAEAARTIVANGEKGKACFQEGHGTEPCPTIDYHPKAGEDWQGAPDRPHHPPAPQKAESGEVEVPPETESQEPAAPPSEESTGSPAAPPSEESTGSPATPPSEESTGIDWPTPGESPASQTAEPTTVKPMTADPTTADSTTAESTTANPTTAEPTTAEPTETGPAGDLSWPKVATTEPTEPTEPTDNVTSPTGSGSYLTDAVKHLENVVGELSGMMEKVIMGTGKSQNVYVTNNYNNVTFHFENISGVSSETPGAESYTQPSGSRGRAPIPLVVPPTPLPNPDMWPLGGVYADQVVVNLDEEVNGTSIYYSINATGTQGTPMEYTEPFVLGPGWTKVEAVAVKEGYNASGVQEAVFHVMACNGDKCCNWRVVYARFEAILGRLLARQKEIPENQIARQRAADADETKWLTAESKYQDAKISKKSAEQGAEYALNSERKWGYAFSASQGEMNDMEKKMAKKLRELLDERELIMDILAKLDSDELSASTAMGMVQQSLAQCSACKAWRSIASSPDGDGAATTFALASTLGGHQEVKDVKAILQEILDDLNARRELYEKMLSGARVQVQDNEKKLNKWTAEAAEMEAQVYKDERTMQEYSSKKQEFAGKVQVSKQAVERGKQFMQDEMDILDRHISAIRRILKRIRVALESCPDGAPEERFAPAPQGPGSLNVEHEHFGPDISQDDDDDDELPQKGLNVEHEHFGPDISKDDDDDELPQKEKSKAELDKFKASSTFPLELGKDKDDDDYADSLKKEEDDIKNFIASPKFA